MCELLVCVKTLGQSGDLSWDSHVPKQGDVVSVQGNGWAWGTCELGLEDHPNYPKHNFFRIIKAPLVTVSQASRMMTPEPDVDPAKPSPYLQFRAFYFDRTKIPVGALRAHWGDDTRALGFLSLPSILASQLNNYVTQRTPVPF
jgi:hypothetical protein